MLVVPGFLYFVFRIQTKNAYHVLPVYGEKKLSGTSHFKMGREIPDTLFHRVPYFQFPNQFGDTVSTKQWQTKIVLLSLCAVNDSLTEFVQPVIYQKKLFDKYGKNKILDFCTISVDSDLKQQQLLSFANRYTAGSNKWLFLHADTTQLYPFLRSGLLMDAVEIEGMPSSKVLFTRKIVLLDTKQRIRGFYDISQASEFDRLDAEILVLTTEEVRNMKDGR
jgi:protein SCO1/2